MDRIGGRVKALSTLLASLALNVGLAGAAFAAGVPPLDKAGSPPRAAGSAGSIVDWLVPVLLIAILVAVGLSFAASRHLDREASRREEVAMTSAATR